MINPWPWFIPILVVFWLVFNATQDKPLAVSSVEDITPQALVASNNAGETKTQARIAAARALPEPTITTVNILGETNVRALDAWNAAVDSKGHLHTAFYPTRHTLLLAGNDKTLPIVDPGTEHEDAPSGLAMSGDQQGAWIAYRNKHPVRDIYLTHTRDLATHTGVSGDSAALARLQIAAMDDTVRVVWYGERGLMGETDDPYPYMVYYNTLTDGTAGETQALLPGIYPVWINDASGGVMIFSWYPDADAATGFRIGTRYSEDGQTFGSEVIVADVPEISPPFAAFESQGRHFVYWIALHGENKAKFLIEGAYSDDQGQTWQDFSFASLQGLDVAQIEHAMDGHGNIALSVVGFFRDNQGEKQRPFLITSTDNGSSWNEPVPLRSEDEEFARAPNAKLAFLPDGELMIVVEDWRSIRSELRYWLSTDLGQTWQIEGEALDLDAGYSYHLAHAVQGLYPTHDGRIHLVFERSTDSFQDKKILHLALQRKDLGKASLHKQDVIPDMERLKERVASYGEALVNRDYQAAYELMDPFYRARVDFLGHLQSQGRIHYREAEFAEAVRFGQLAFVGIRIVASVPRFTSGGRDVEVPQREMIAPTRWLWLDGEWYMEMRSEAQDMSFAQY